MSQNGYGAVPVFFVCVLRGLDRVQGRTIAIHTLNQLTGVLHSIFSNDRLYAHIGIHIVTYVHPPTQTYTHPTVHTHTRTYTHPHIRLHTYLYILTYLHIRI